MVRKKLLTFEISRYYSPVVGQDKYLSSKPGYFGENYVDKFSGRGYEPGYEFDVCMNCGCNDIKKQLYDCTKPANGQTLVQSDVGKSVACPKEILLGTKIYIENYGLVTCKDRGGAIKINGKTKVIRLDLRVGYGNQGVRNMQNKSVLHGKRNGYFPNKNELLLLNK